MTGINGQENNMRPSCKELQKILKDNLVYNYKSFHSCYMQAFFYMQVQLVVALTMRAS